MFDNIRNSSARSLNPLFQCVSLTLILLAAVTVSQALPAAISDCRRQAFGKLDGVEIWHAGNALGFSTSKLNVDADGAPNSYRLDGKGLSFTCDGVSAIVNGRTVTPKSDPHNWQRLCQQAWTSAQETENYSEVHIFGFLTDKDGKPVIQMAGDPLPNEAYITTTKLTIPNTPDNTQRHWVDATRIPYIVFSSSFAMRAHLVPGDVAVVYRPRNGAIAFGIFADCCTPGEASIRLHEDLKNNPIELDNGVKRAKKRIEDKVTTIILPARSSSPSSDSAAWYQDIQNVGKDALTKWGGLDRLRACAK